jgi:hypothetical protein
MNIRYWILTVAVGLGSYWLLADLLGSVLLAGFMTVWPCSLAAIYGITRSESASDKARENRPKLAEQDLPEA